MIDGLIEDLLDALWKCIQCIFSLLHIIYFIPNDYYYFVYNRDIPSEAKSPTVRIDL